MIDLSIDLAYLSRYMGVAAAMSYAMKSGQMSQVQGGEKDGMLTIVTEDGMITVDAALMEKLLQKPEKLAKILRLEDVNNRYLIIQQFNEEDLLKLLPFLTSEQLSFGLQYFTVDGLENLLIELPQEQLINTLLLNFTMADVVPFMQENEMAKFFKSTNLEKKDVMEYLKGLDFYEKLQPMMIKQFGYDFKDKSADECLYHVENLEADEYQRFLQNLDTKEKAEMITGLCEINPDYYAEFENSILVRPIINLMEKPDIIKSMKTLEPEFLIPMIEQLPKDLIQVVATQIEPADFAEMLSGEFPDLIMQMLAG